jgi:hypothetical protein
MKSIFVDTVEQAVEVIKWWNNHSLALGLFQQEQLTRNGKTLALILAVLTRWTTHYLSVNRLLFLSRPLQSCVLNHREELMNAAGKKPELVAAAIEILDTVRNDTFWKNLEE